MATIVTPFATLSYPHLITPKANDQGKLKYSAALIFAPGTDLTELKKAALEAAIGKFGREIAVAGNKIPIETALKEGVLRWPFRNDWLKKGYPEGSIYLNVNGEVQPGLALAHTDPKTGKVAICPPNEIDKYFYPGAQVRAVLNPYGYDNKQKGVTFGLNHLQFVGHGERLDSRTKVEDEFGALQEAPAVASVDGLL